VLLLALPAPPAGGQAGGDTSGSARVLVTTVADPITPVIADHLGDAVERAAEGGYQALVVRLDTPGGLDTSMREIVQSFLGADVPVIVHVAPRGARAASAGAIITFAAHVAAMAPGTAIGAATPVQLEGGDAGEKAVQDARAFAESVAEVRGRNVEFAADTVLEARSASASEAVDIGAVDLVAADTDALLAAIDGSRVELAGGDEVVLATADALVEEYRMSLFRRILQFLADPNLAFLFLSIGTLGIIYELASPGIGVGGVIGVVMVVLALFALSVLPVNAAGFLFLFIALALFVAELFAPGIGVFAFLGAGMLVLSGLFLFSEDAPGLELSLAAVLPTAVVVGGSVVLAGRLVVQARRRESASDVARRFAGRELVVERARDRAGQARIEGVWWNVRGDAPLHEGERVVVERVDGLELVVVPVEGGGLAADSPETGTGAPPAGDTREGAEA
jgi:membrane-bound serine protease (ClpP class)